MECELCKGRKVMQKVMKILDDEMPEPISTPFYDDPISDIYDALDNAMSTWQCMCEEEPAAVTE